ncbi:MAG: hypothetical protein IKU54_02785 [Oscillospiraceae bacterium]|nr:hypothetical protein [Oscillospiraceae bacterium]
MKKFVTITLAIILAMSLMTGCSRDTEQPQDTQPTPAPTPAATPAPQEEGIENPNYRTVLAMWTDLDGYWAASDGHYLHFTLDENGKAQMHSYDKEGKLTAYAQTKAVMASNKTSYIMELDFPAGQFEDINQFGTELTYNIEIAGYGDGYVEISVTNDKTIVYAYAGDDTTQLKEAVKYATNIEKLAEETIDDTKQ